MFGGVRFGGTLTVDSAFALRLRSHCSVHGRRQAHSDPDEERSGAWRSAGIGLPDGASTYRRREDRSVANLQVRMPVVVIGGGLTAIDTATESLAYYAVQVEKFLDALRDAGRRARRTSCPRQLDAGRARDCGSSSLRMAARFAPSALPLPARAGP